MIGLSPYAMISSEPAISAMASEANSARSWPTRPSSHAGRDRGAATTGARPSVAIYATGSFDPPSIPTPISSGGASGGNSPVILPS